MKDVIPGLSCLQGTLPWRSERSASMFFRRLLRYLNPATLFGKADPNVNLRFMHGINRISILMFLACLGVMVWRGCMH